MRSWKRHASDRSARVRSAIYDARARGIGMAGATSEKKKKGTQKKNARKTRESHASGHTHPGFSAPCSRPFLLVVFGNVWSTFFSTSFFFFQSRERCVAARARTLPGERTDARGVAVVSLSACRQASRWVSRCTRAPERGGRAGAFFQNVQRESCPLLPRRLHVERPLARSQPTSSAMRRRCGCSSRTDTGRERQTGKAF